MKLPNYLLTIAMFGVAACTTYTGEPANPIERSLTWFSYLAGDDIKAACRSGAPDRYRFVYNGIYQRQIRGYELTPTATGAELTVRARGISGQVDRFGFDHPFGPWEMVNGRAELDNATAAKIVDDFATAVATSPSAAGKNLDSNAYYWIVASCSGGVFSLHGFLYPDVDTNALAFAKLLLAHDDSGVPFRAAKHVEGLDRDVFSVQINAAGNDLVGRL